MITMLFAVTLALTGPVKDPLAPPVVTVLKQLPALPPGAVYVRPSLSNGLLAVCHRDTTQVLGPDGLPVKKLNELPQGIEEHAVLRTVNGCPVREVVYAGQTYYLDAPLGGLVRDLRGSRTQQHGH